MNRRGKHLVFADHPDLRIGLTTQNFRLAMPVSVASLREIMEYSSSEGYHFVEIRDDNALLTADDCRNLADLAQSLGIGVIYEIHRNPLDPAFEEVFGRGLSNTVLFPGPGMLRILLSLSEFIDNPDKKGWTGEELEKVIHIAEESAALAKSRNVRLIVENINEPFFGDGSTCFGLSDFFDRTVLTGLQFDISNPFTRTARMSPEPEDVTRYLSLLGKRWMTTHLKTIVTVGGTAQPVLTDNPIPVRKVVEMM